MIDPSRPHKIVVGIDGSAPSVDALRWAVGQAQMTGATVEAVMVWQRAAGLIPSAAEDLEAESRQDLDRVIGGAFPSAAPVKVTRVIEQGDPAFALVERSRDTALPVIGSRGHGAFVGMLIGSVSQYCVTHAHCPVVVIRTPSA